MIITVYVDDNVVIPSYSIASGNANWINLTGNYTETVPNSTRRLKVGVAVNPAATAGSEIRINWTYITMTKT